MKRYVFLVPMLLLLVLLPLALGVFSKEMGEKVSTESLQMMETAITRAAVECYALEGFYPPHVDYLTQRYGIVVDRTRFFIDYLYLGSNLVPDITVLPVTGGGANG